MRILRWKPMINTMKQFLTLIFAFCYSITFGQEIQVENSIAYIDGKPYVKIIKKNKKNIFIYNIRTNEKILKIQLEKKYNERTDSYYPNTKLFFLHLDKSAAFSETKVVTQKEIIQLLVDKQLILTDGSLNEELAIEYHETSPIGRRCAKILDKNFAGILYHKFRPIVGKDTLKINEVKYECVKTALYTRKVLYDRFGMWTKEIYRYGAPNRLPELAWQDVQLLEDDEKKFTIVARGLESAKTIYASIMIFDENNYDMLDAKSPYRDKLVKLIGDFIKNDKESREFFKVFWSKYDPERWQKILAENQRMNNPRRYQYGPTKKPNGGKN
jgi:hypothetical protein